MTEVRPVDPTDPVPADATGDQRLGDATPDAPYEASAPVSASRAVGVGAPTIIESNGDPVDVQSSSTRTVLVEPSHVVEGPAQRRVGTADPSSLSADAPATARPPARPTAADPVVPLAETAPVSASSHVAESDAPIQAYEAPAPTRILQTDPAEAREAPTIVTAAPGHAETVSTTPVAAEPVIPPPPATQTVYVQQPVAPKKKGNRGFGVLMSILGTIVFALVWAGVAAAVIALSTSADRFSDSMSTFVMSAAFITPIAVFLVAMVLLALLVNRGGWPWYIVGGFLVGVLVYGGYLAGGLITVASRITQSEVEGFLTSVAITPLAIAAGVAAREVALWTGLLISARGKRVKAKNVESRAAFDRDEAARAAS